MLQLVKEIGVSLNHLFFPQVCVGCGTDTIGRSQKICLRCLHRLPSTNFHLHPNNPAEKTFWGRIPVTSVASYLYFTKNSLLQRLLHQLKYKGNREIGHFLGKEMGAAFIQSDRFRLMDALVALPLFPDKERKRGYNQAAVLCEGFSEASGIPFLEKVIARKKATETQTHKSRIERWQNMEDRFQLLMPEAISNKRILLIDDVLTTGATLEACGLELLKAPGVELNIGTLAFTSR